MEREVGGGIGMGNTCKPMAVSFQCMTKSTTNKLKKKKKENISAVESLPVTEQSGNWLYRWQKNWEGKWDDEAVQCLTRAESCSHPHTWTNDGKEAVLLEQELKPFCARYGPKGEPQQGSREVRGYRGMGCPIIAGTKEETHGCQK